MAAKADIGYASEDMRLYRGQSLRWHVDLVRRIYPGWDEAYAAELMQRFDLRPDQAVGGFSHGQRVKSLLLLCLARRPRLLLLDEPTTGLDPVARIEVLEALADVLRDERRSVLFSSHNTADIEQIADTITFIHGGGIVASRDKESFLDSWRRVLCQGAWTEGLRHLPGVVSARNSAPLIELKTRAFDEATLPALQALGHTGLQGSDLLGGFGLQCGQLLHGAGLQAGQLARHAIGQIGRALGGGFAAQGFFAAQGGQFAAPQGGQLVHALAVLFGPGGFAGGRAPCGGCALPV